MKNFFNTSVIAHPVVLAAAGFVVLVGIGSGIYYVAETGTPPTPSIPQTTSSSAAITGTGTVEPAQNPDLAFEASGKVTHVYVAVGDSVKQGQTLAALDSSTLSAQRAQAVAGLNAQQANLAQMQAGARPVDIAAKQTAVSQAQLALSNLYATVPDVLNDAYNKVYSTLHTDTDTIFSNPDSTSPSVVFSSSDTQSTTNVIQKRIAINSDLIVWKGEIAALNSSDTTALEVAITQDLAHLAKANDYTTSVSEALANGISTTAFPQSSISAAIVAVGAMQDTVGGRITALQSLSQQIATSKLAVQSAQDALNQTLAGSTKEEIAAQEAQVEASQANVDSIDAQIAKTVITAPFAGMVSSVRVKVGDTVSSDLSAVSITPQSALQITAYFSEVDAASIAVGTSANVTLDAYGSGRVFPATVLEVDHSPTQQNGVPAYKVTLVFASSDPAIEPGMTANVTINQ